MAAVAMRTRSRQPQPAKAVVVDPVLELRKAQERRALENRCSFALSHLRCLGSDGHGWSGRLGRRFCRRLGKFLAQLPREGLPAMGDSVVLPRTTAKKAGLPVRAA